MTDFDHRLIDELIHSPVRLSVMAVLATVESAEFSYLREAAKTTDGTLLVHLRKLEAGGYVRSTQRLSERRAVTDYSLTRKGRDAFSAYVKHLESLVSAGRDKGRK